MIKSLLKSFETAIRGFGRGIPAEALAPKYLTPESAFLDTGGMQVHYRTTGSGPSLLLLHGVASSLHTWSAWHTLLSEDFTVTSVDLPGFGLTGPHPDGDYSIAMYTRVFNALLDHLGVRQTHLAGNSFGGYLTWNYALEEPGRLQKIVLQDSAGFLTRYSEVSDPGFLLAAYPATRRLTWWITPRALIKDSLRNAVAPGFRITPEMTTRYHDLLLRQGNRKAFSQILNEHIVNGRDNTERIAQVSVPTLVQWGEEDALINIGHAFLFRRTIAGAKLVSYPGTGHLPMEEIPEQSAKDVREFLLGKAGNLR